MSDLLHFLGGLLAGAVLILWFGVMIHLVRQSFRDAFPRRV